MSNQRIARLALKSFLVTAVLAGPQQVPHLRVRFYLDKSFHTLVSASL